jgi:hypothetical protein
MEDIINTHKILVGKPQEEWPFGGPMGIWEDNIAMDIKLMRDECAKLIQLA